MIEIAFAQTGDAFEAFIALVQEYVGWMIAEIPRQYPALDLEAFTAGHAYDDVRRKFPGDHVPPHGCLLIARYEGAVCGCIALGRLNDTMGEMRTLYVRPAIRSLGVGKRLVEAALGAAKAFGYQTIRLDTLGFMVSAQRLYRSLGFYEIAPYLALPASLEPYICFMECPLTNEPAVPGL